MSEWKEYKLGEVAEFRNGKARPNEEGSVPIYGGNGILGYTNQHNSEGEVVVIGRVGAYCGSVYFENRPIWVSDNALFSLPRNSNDTRFLSYFVRNLDLNSFAEGSSHPLLTQTLLNSIDVLFPADANEQRAIASVLSSLDDKIDLLHRQNKTLEALAETLFRQWFVEEDSQTGKVDDLIEILSGFAFQSKDFVESGKYRLVTIKNVQDGVLDLSRTDYLDNIPERMPAYCLLERGDILLSLTGNVGRCCLVTEDGLLLNQRVAKLKPKKDRDFTLTYTFFRLNSTRQQLEELAKGTAQANLSPIETKELEIPLPSQDKLQLFADHTNPFIRKVLQNSYQIRTLTQMRDTLLPKLMSGEIRVNSEQ